MNVLIVDDLMKDASMARDILLECKSDLEIIIETNSLKAKKILSSQAAENIDLLILDLQMPKVDGIQILEFMEEKGIQIPVIVCSNFIEKYQDELDQVKVVKTFSKKSFLSVNPNTMADIFLQLNSLKSCMVLDGQISKYVKRKKKITCDFYESLNDLKKELYQNA